MPLLGSECLANLLVDPFDRLDPIPLQASAAEAATKIIPIAMRPFGNIG
jgi:hypothetical protein